MMMSDKIKIGDREYNDIIHDTIELMKMEKHAEGKVEGYRIILVEDYTEKEYRSGWYVTVSITESYGTKQEVTWFMNKKEADKYFYTLAKKYNLEIVKDGGE